MIHTDLLFRPSLCSEDGKIRLSHGNFSRVVGFFCLFVLIYLYLVCTACRLSPALDGGAELAFLAPSQLALCFGARHFILLGFGRLIGQIELDDFSGFIWC